MWSATSSEMTGGQWESRCPGPPSGPLWTLLLVIVSFLGASHRPNPHARPSTLPTHHVMSALITPSPPRTLSRTPRRHQHPHLRRFQTPLRDGNSTVAWGSTPMPLRTMRSDPSPAPPEQVTTCPWPWRSRSTTQKSTMGPRLVVVSRTSRKLSGWLGSGGWACNLVWEGGAGSGNLETCGTLGSRLQAAAGEIGDRGRLTDLRPPLGPPSRRPRFTQGLAPLHTTQCAVHHATHTSPPTG